MHFGGCFGEFAYKAIIVRYVKLIPQPHTTDDVIIGHNNNEKH